MEHIQFGWGTWGNDSSVYKPERFKPAPVGITVKTSEPVDTDKTSQISVPLYDLCAALKRQ